MQFNGLIHCVIFFILFLKFIFVLISIESLGSESFTIFGYLSNNFVVLYLEYLNSKTNLGISHSVVGD